MSPQKHVQIFDVETDRSGASLTNNEARKV